MKWLYFQRDIITFILKQNTDYISNTFCLMVLKEAKEN